MDKETTQKIISQAVPCLKCGSKPIIVTEECKIYGNSHETILKCSNPKCRNEIFLRNGPSYQYDIDEWNRFNSKMFKPRSGRYNANAQICYNCSLVNRCIYGKYGDSSNITMVCNDFKL